VLDTVATALYPLGTSTSLRLISASSPGGLDDSKPDLELLCSDFNLHEDGDGLSVQRKRTGLRPYVRTRAPLTLTTNPAHPTHPTHAAHQVKALPAGVTANEWRGNVRWPGGAVMVPHTRGRPFLLAFNFEAFMAKGACFNGRVGKLGPPWNKLKTKLKYDVMVDTKKGQLVDTGCACVSPEPYTPDVFVGDPDQSACRAFVIITRSHVTLSLVRQGLAQFDEGRDAIGL